MTAAAPLLLSLGVLVLLFRADRPGGYSHQVRPGLHELVGIRDFTALRRVVGSVLGAGLVVLVTSLIASLLHLVLR